MIIIKINIKVAIIAISISSLMYPQTIEKIVNDTRNFKIAKILSTSTIEENNVAFDPYKTNIIFMFDSGWDSVYKDAYEIMEKYNYKGSVSLIPSRIDKKDYMKYENLSELYLQGWDMLNHSYTHEENIYDNVENLYSDINRAKQWMENRYIGSHSDMVVMPYGEVNPYLFRVLKDAGFRNVRTSDNIILLDKDVIEYYPVTTINLKPDTNITYVENLLRLSIYEHKTIIIILNKISDIDDGYGMTYSKDKFEQIIEFIYNNSDKYQVITYSQLF